MCRASAACAMSMVRFITSKPPSFGTCASADSGSPVARSVSSATPTKRFSTVRPVGVSSSDRAALVSSSCEVLRHIRFSHSAVGRGSRSPRRDSGSSPDRLIAMVASAMTAAIGAIGIGSRMPPSASSRPFRTWGEITPGIAIDARMASSTGPRCNHTDLPVIRSVATEVNGIGSSSMVTSPRISRTASRIFSARSTPAAAIDGSSRRNTARWVSELAHVAYSSSLSAACRPPTRAPIDDPATPTISCPRSRSSLITPMWAYPRAPPLPRASATRIAPFCALGAQWIGNPANSSRQRRARAGSIFSALTNCVRSQSIIIGTTAGALDIATAYFIRSRRPRHRWPP